MVIGFDPASIPVRHVLIAVMLASLLMSAAPPWAFGADGLLFAGAYACSRSGETSPGPWCCPATIRSTP